MCPLRPTVLTLCQNVKFDTNARARPCTTPSVLEVSLVEYKS